MLPFSSYAYDPEEDEEPAGGSFAVLLNFQDNIYGCSVGSGSWIRNTPIFGDFFLRLYSSGIEDTWYSGLGMTIRIMPHWRFAPFIGAGGSYDFSFTSQQEEYNNPFRTTQEELPDQGDSYWGGHVETGFRLWLANRIQLFELLGRYTWTSLTGDHDYWLIGLSTGLGY